MNLPHLTIYTDKLPANVGGRATGPVVRIRPEYRDDKGIHAHEQVHVNQWYGGLLLGALVAAVLYYFGHEAWPLALFAGAVAHPMATLNESYTLWKEVVAYKEQAKHYPDDRLPLFAEYIAHNYGLSVTPEQAHAALTKD